MNDDPYPTCSIPYNWVNDCTSKGREHDYLPMLYPCADGSKQLRNTCRLCYHRGQPIKQPHNIGRNRRTVGTDNGKHTAYWRDKMGGVLWCAFCQLNETSKIWFGHQVHHIIPVSLGGSDESWNTAIYCTHCHSAQQVHAKHMRRLDEYVKGGSNA